MVISRYATYLLDRASPADKDYIASELYDSTKLASPGSVLKSDLEYVAHNWDKDGFDLWFVSLSLLSCSSNHPGD